MKRKLFILSLLFVSVMTIAQTTYIVTAQSLRVRNTPNTEGAVLGALSSGQEILVEQIVNGWAKFQYKGNTAYTSSKYLVEKVVEVAQDEPDEYVIEATTIANEYSDAYKSQNIKGSQSSVQYIAVKKPTFELLVELAMMDFPMGNVYDYYNTFNFGQHYSLGGKVFFTDNLYASLALDWQWFDLNRSVSGMVGYKYHTNTEEAFVNYVGVPIKIGYGGGGIGSYSNGRHQFGISAGFWLGGYAGGFTKYENDGSKSKVKNKGEGFIWAPIVSVCWRFVSIQYRAYFAKGSDIPTHTLGLSFSY